MVDLVDVSTGDIITSARSNLIKDYIHDGIHLINTLSVNIGGIEIIDSSGNITTNVGTVDGIDIGIDVAANTAKVTNATHIGEVTGATSLTIADNVVTLAKMAHGTDGNLITYDTTGAPAYVATGTATQVLTSNGVGTAPTFQASSLQYETFTAGENVVSGNLCYLKSDGKMWKADASADTTSNTLLAIATETINATASGVFLLNGKFTTSGLTVGTIQYVSETAGALTELAPTTSTAIVRIVGYALSTTVLYFNVDNSYIEVA